MGKGYQKPKTGHQVRCRMLAVFKNGAMSGYFIKILHSEKLEQKCDVPCDPSLWCTTDQGRLETTIDGNIGSLQKL